MQQEPRMTPLSLPLRTSRVSPRRVQIGNGGVDLAGEEGIQKNVVPQRHVLELV